MPTLTIEVCHEQMEVMRRQARLEGFSDPAELVTAIVGDHVLQTKLLDMLDHWRSEEDGWTDELITDPGGGVWHEDDYEGE